MEAGCSAENPQQPNWQSIHQPASSEVLQQKQFGTQNKDMEKRKAAWETIDADAPTQPHKKLKTEEMNLHTQQPTFVHFHLWRGDINKMFSCSVCQYHTPDEEAIVNHFYSSRHKEILRYLFLFNSEDRVNFLHEYLLFTKKKMCMEQKKSNQQPIKDKFEGIDEEDYYHRIQAAYCEACDVLIPDVPEILISHKKSCDHNVKCKDRFANIKSRSLATACNFFQNEDILQMLKQYIRKQNPFEKMLCSLQVSTDDVPDAGDKDPIAHAKNVSKVPVNHNEGPADENKDVDVPTPPCKKMNTEILKPPPEKSSCDQTERTMYGHSDPERGYRGRREKPSPHRPQPGPSDDPKENRGNVESSPPVRHTRSSTPPEQRAVPEKGSFPHLWALSANFYFGGGFKVKRSSRRWNQKKVSQDGGEPAEKRMRTTSENGTEFEKSELERGGNTEDPEQCSRSEVDSEDEKQEETEHIQPSSKSSEEKPNWTMVCRNQFSCTLCNFRTLYNNDMKNHLQSEFHKEHLCHVGETIPKQFLQEYMLYQYKKIQEWRGFIEDTAVEQLCHSEDLTRGLGLEHFVKKVEAAHCVACDVFIPMCVLKRHLQSPSHDKNCGITMEKSKKRANFIISEILRNKHVNQKLAQYRKGENPFIDDGENSRRGCSSDPDPEAQESGQLPRSKLSDSSKMMTVEGKASEQSQMEVKEKEDVPGGQDIEEEDAEDYACEVI